MRLREMCCDICDILPMRFEVFANRGIGVIRTRNIVTFMVVSTLVVKRMENIEPESCFTKKAGSLFKQYSLSEKL